VEQTGTDSYCENGVAKYAAWIEFCPDAAVFTTLPVSPGDVISASVSYAGNDTFDLMIGNVTRGEVFTYQGVFTGANGSGKPQRSTAEWILERAGNVAMPNFGTASFGQAFTGGNAWPNIATDALHSFAPIGAFSENALSTSSASVGSLGFDGQSFQLTYAGSGGGGLGGGGGFGSSCDNTCYGCGTTNGCGAYCGDCGGGGTSTSACGVCTIGSMQCRDNSEDQICGADGNGCGVWYDHAACGDNICVYAQCGDGDGPSTGSPPPDPAPSCTCSTDDDCLSSGSGDYCDGCNCQW
jgi:hypothetical protein